MKFSMFQGGNVQWKWNGPQNLLDIFQIASSDFFGSLAFLLRAKNVMCMFLFAFLRVGFGAVGCCQHYLELAVRVPISGSAKLKLQEESFAGSTTLSPRKTVGGRSISKGARWYNGQCQGHPDFLEEISPEDVSEKWALALNLSSSAVCVITRCSMYMIY